MRRINYANSWLMGIDPVATGRQLKKLRRQHNFTQEDLSELFEWCDISASRVSISVWENGKKTPSLLHIVFLAELYGCTLDELVVSYRRSHERELEDRDQPVPLILLHLDECMRLHMFVFFYFVNLRFLGTTSQISIIKS